MRDTESAPMRRETVQDTNGFPSTKVLCRTHTSVVLSFSPTLLPRIAYIICCFGSYVGTERPSKRMGDVQREAISSHDPWDSTAPDCRDFRYARPSVSPSLSLLSWFCSTTIIILLYILYWEPCISKNDRQTASHCTQYTRLAPLQPSLKPFSPASSECHNDYADCRIQNYYIIRISRICS